MLLEDRGARERLLWRFPKSSLDSFHVAIGKNGKGVQIEAIVEKATDDELCEFVVRRFGLLRQHVHLFQLPPHLTRALDDQQSLFGDGAGPYATRHGEERHYTYILPLTYRVYFSDPFDEVKVPFLWPVRLIAAPDHVRVHFAMISPELRAHVDRDYETASRSPRNRNQLLERAQLLLGRQFVSLDVNGGVKSLWEDDVVDAQKAQYKRPNSTAKEVMDEAFTIKQHDRDRYEQIILSVLYDCTFKFLPGATGLARMGYFTANPAFGTFAFRRQSKANHMVDEFIADVLERNRSPAH